MSGLIRKLALVLVVATAFAQDEDGATASGSGGKCETEDDLDYMNCRVEQLPIEGLKQICERMELDIDNDIFPYILQDLEEADPNDYDPEQLAKEIQQIKDKTQPAYVAAAYECLMVEEHMEEGGGSTPDPFEIAQIVEDIVTRDPDVVHELERELMEDNEDLWEEIKKNLKEGESLIDRPDLLADLVSTMLREDPDILHDLVGDDDDEDEYGEDDDELEEDL